MYYKFDESGSSATQNFANPGVGLNPAPLVGQTMGGTGQFGSALVGTGVANNYVNTGWTTALGTGSWTISMWLNNLPSNTTLYYLWGDNTAGSFRSFLGGAAGAGNVTLRVTGLTDCIVTGVAPGPTVVTYVYDAAANQVRGYKNGVLAVTATPTAPLNINGTGVTPFRVGAYSTSTGLPANGLMDEFRMYNRALDASEIALTWNQPLPLGTPGWSQQTSGITTPLYTVKAVTPQIVWTAGAGGVVLRTTNGGSTWTSVGGGNLGTADLYNITAVSATTAFTTTTTTTATYIFRTTNGGTTWDTVFVQPGGFLNAIHMFDANNGIAQGDPVGGRWTVLRTSNGGATWVRDTVNAPLQVGGEYGANNGLKAIGTNYIWWTPGTGNGLYYTTNGGTTWTRVTLPASGFTAGIDFLDTQYGVVGNGSGAAARTTNGGAT
ncbi:MAG TPA: LamG-like jellyroll fold domain-containing protein, partial [Bacteroidota bacterium]|nr:LamG-like jellyroll fold domain-containing protein [Bacteroidota bacterium]